VDEIYAVIMSWAIALSGYLYHAADHDEARQ
jgi:hypothetical protein